MHLWRHTTEPAPREMQYQPITLFQLFLIPVKIQNRPNGPGNAVKRRWRRGDGARELDLTNGCDGGCREPSDAAEDRVHVPFFPG